MSRSILKLETAFKAPHFCICNTTALSAAVGRLNNPVYGTHCLQIDANELSDDLEDCSDKDRQTLADWVCATASLHAAFLLCILTNFFSFLTIFKLMPSAFF